MTTITVIFSAGMFHDNQMNFGLTYSSESETDSDGDTYVTTDYIFSGGYFYSDNIEFTAMYRNSSQEYDDNYYSNLNMDANGYGVGLNYYLKNDWVKDGSLNFIFGLSYDVASLTGDYLDDLNAEADATYTTYEITTYKKISNNTIFATVSHNEYEFEISDGITTITDTGDALYTTLGIGINVGSLVITPMIGINEDEETRFSVNASIGI